jgi:hypothetical protein
MNLKTLPIGQIKPYWRNPRNNDKAVPVVKASIEQYGFQQPIVVDAKHVIIAGHTRYRAMVELGATEIPCIVADLAPEKAKAYRIADNKAAEVAKWNNDGLIQELRELGTGAADLYQFFGGEDGLAETLSAMDAAPFEVVTQQQLADHGDELQQQFEQKVAEAKAVMIEVACPCCLATFKIDSSEIGRRAQKAREDGLDQL